MAREGDIEDIAREAASEFNWYMSVYLPDPKLGPHPQLVALRTKDPTLARMLEAIALQALTVREHVERNYPQKNEG